MKFQKKMRKTINILEANKSNTSLIWQKESEDHIDKWLWQKYSMQIALRIRARMQEMGLTQSALAKKTGCSQQYISLLLKGKENMTLETISKLEVVLDINILSFDSPKADSYLTSSSYPKYLNDNNAVIYDSAKSE